VTPEQIVSRWVYQDLPDDRRFAVDATDYDDLIALAKRLRKQGTWAYHHAETCRCETCQLDHDSAWLA
jgi:hypothetical protein